MDLNKKQREGLKAHQVSFDRKESWNAIEERLGQKKRGRFFIWFLSGITSAALLLYVYNEYHSNHSNILEEQVVAIQNYRNKLSAQAADISPIEEIKNNDKIAELHVNSEVKKIDQTEKITQDNLGNRYDIQLNQKRIEQNFLNESETPIRVQYSNRSSNETPIVSQGNTGQNHFKNEIQSNAQIATLEIDDISFKQEINNQSAEREISVVEQISTITNKLEWDRNEKFYQPPTFPTNNQKNIEVQIFGGYGVPLRTLSERNILGSEFALERKKSVEEVLDFMSIGLGIKKLISKDFYLIGSIEYGQITNRLQLRQHQVMSIQAIDMDELPEELKGKVGVAIFNKNIDVYNRIQLFDVQAAAGYQRKLGKWTVGPELGIGFNINSKFTGYSSPNNTTLLENPDYYQSNIGLFGSIGLPVGYGLSSKIQIFVQPTFKYYFDAFNNDQNPVEVKYHNLYLKAGVGFRF